MGYMLGYKKEKQRLFCQGYSAKRRFFAKVLETWEEENIGTDDEKYIVTIKKGYSFMDDDHMHTMIFDSSIAAMNGIKKIYICECDYCKDA